MFEGDFKRSFEYADESNCGHIEKVKVEDFGEFVRITRSSCTDEHIDAMKSLGIFEKEPSIDIPKLFIKSPDFDDLFAFIRTRAHLRKHVTPEVVTWDPIEEER